MRSLEVEAVETKNHDTEQKIELLVMYSGKQGHQLLSKTKKHFKKTLPYFTKLSTKFPVKDKTNFQHKHNVVYYGKCPKKDARMTLFERQKDA